MFRKNRHRVAYYEAGDVISFRVRGEKSKVTAQIHSFEDTLIVFRHYKVSPSEITDLYVDDKTRIWYVLRYKYEKIFLIAGAGYLLLDAINTGDLTKETITISGSLLALGGIARVVISKRMKIRGKRKLEIVTR